MLSNGTPISEQAGNSTANISSSANTTLNPTNHSNDILGNEKNDANDVLSANMFAEMSSTGNPADTYLSTTKVKFTEPNSDFASSKAEQLAKGYMQFIYILSARNNICFAEYIEMRLRFLNQ